MKPVEIVLRSRGKRNKESHCIWIGYRECVYGHTIMKPCVHLIHANKICVGGNRKFSSVLVVWGLNSGLSCACKACAGPLESQP
jgi:hypothetical protein